MLDWTECHGQEPAAIDEMAVEYLTTREVAQRLRIPVSNVIYLLASGKLAGTKVNNRWHVTATALKEYIEALRKSAW